MTFITSRRKTVTTCDENGRDTRYPYALVGLHTRSLTSIRDLVPNWAIADPHRRV